MNVIGTIDYRKDKRTNVVIENLKKAIVESKKNFNDIPEATIFSFLERGGISKSIWKDIYSDVSEHFNPKKKPSSYYNGAFETKTSAINTPKPVISTAIVHDIMERNPRKSVFSEIKKI